MINGITATIPIAYGICVLFSAVVLICYLRFVKEKHIWLLLMIISVCVVNVGYLCLSLSPSLNHALMANRIAYLGNVFQPVPCRYKKTACGNNARLFFGYADIGFYHGCITVVLQNS